MDKFSHQSRLPDHPNFAFVDEKIDGLIPACKVESWEKFIEIMRRPEYNMAKGEMVYRGQRGHDWNLSSTLSRMFETGTVPPGHQADLLGQFRLAMRGRGLDVSKLEEEEIWAFGQHHGLRTPLIDWTKSPYVALFFAFEEPDLADGDNPARAVFCLNMAAIRADEDMHDWIFEPTHHENARLVNQAGLFTITPAGSDNVVSAILNNLAENGVINPDDPNDVAKYICKFHVPNDNRTACLNTLRKMNIHHANLFPDPGGASRYCNDWLAGIIEAERLDAEAASRTAERERRKKIDPQAFASKAGDVDENIAQLLRTALTGPSLVKIDRLRSWAPKILAIYDREASIDWPQRTAEVAKLRVEFRRFFLSNSVDKEMAEVCTDLLLTFFKERLEMANG